MMSLPTWRSRPSPAPADAPTSAPVQPEAEPYHADGGPTGVLVCHGFTGSPYSMRPWAEDLAARGYSVALPRLPGHGTDWRELNQTRWQDWYACVDDELTTLSRRCAERGAETGGPARVFVVGLSMGGALALRLAQRRGHEVAGLVLVNPAVCADAQMTYLLPVLRLLVPSVAGITNDIAKPGVREGGYPRTPLHAAYSMTQMFCDVRDHLTDVTAPLLLLTSDVDHVVAPPAARLILARVRSGILQHRRLRRSWHVATLDWDAPEIFTRSAHFLEQICAAAPASLAASAGLSGASSR